MSAVVLSLTVSAVIAFVLFAGRRRLERAAGERVQAAAIALLVVALVANIALNFLELDNRTRIGALERPSVERVDRNLDRSLDRCQRSPACRRKLGELLRTVERDERRRRAPAPRRRSSSTTTSGPTERATSRRTSTPTRDPDRASPPAGAPPRSSSPRRPSSPTPSSPAPSPSSSPSAPAPPAADRPLVDLGVNLPDPLPDADVEVDVGALELGG